MTEETTSNKSPDLEALEHALYESARLNGRADTTLHALNKAGWVLVQSEEVYFGPRFDEDEIRVIEFLAMTELEDSDGDFGLAINNLEYGKAEIVARNLHRCQKILNRIAVMWNRPIPYPQAGN